MADPVTIALIAAAATQTAGSIQQGKAAEAQAESQADIARYNQAVAENQAIAEEQAAAEQALRQSEEGKRFQARQRALVGTTGVQARGSVLSVLEDTAKTLELDRLEILRQGSISAGQRRSQAVGFGLEAQAYKSQAKSAKRATVLSAIGGGLNIATASSGLFKPKPTTGKFDFDKYGGGEAIGQAFLDR